MECFTCNSHLCTDAFSFFNKSDLSLKTVKSELMANLRQGPIII